MATGCQHRASLPWRQDSLGQSKVVSFPSVLVLYPFYGNSCGNFWINKNWSPNWYQNVWCISVGWPPMASQRSRELIFDALSFVDSNCDRSFALKSVLPPCTIFSLVSHRFFLMTMTSGSTSKSWGAASSLTCSSWGRSKISCQSEGVRFGGAVEDIQVGKSAGEHGWMSSPFSDIFTDFSLHGPTSITSASSI